MNDDSSEILITGGTGILGAAISAILIAKGQKIKILTRNKNLNNTKNVTYFYGDINNDILLRKALTKCKKVFHCAAEKTNPTNMRNINVEGTRTLFNACKDMNISYFCHISSVGVIGEISDSFVNENTKCVPMNLYEETKYEAEQIVTKGLPNAQIIILRPTNIFSTETFSNINKLSSQFKYWIKGNENAHLVFNNDVAHAAVFFAEKKLNKSVECFIVSSDEEKGNTYKDIFTFINNFKGYKSFFKYPPPSFIPYYYRKLKHGKTNKGNIIYSSQKIIQNGFTFPFGLYKGIQTSLQNK